MKVYLLWRADYDNCLHRGIFSTLGKAQAEGLSTAPHGTWRQDGAKEWYLADGASDLSLQTLITEVTVDATL